MTVTLERKPQIPTNASVFAARGAVQALWGNKSEEVGLSGPAGTGKSRGILERLNAICNKYPNSRHLIVRKTRASLTQSGLVTFEEHVKPNCDVDRMNRSVRDEYRYSNGAVIVIGGMDKPTKVMSTEYDTIYMQEAIEFNLDDIESLSTRARNGMMPYQQIVYDTNPGKATHWLKKRAESGASLMLESRHEDNARMFDVKTKDFTEYGQKYISRLDKLTGVRYLRLRKGLWVSAEGMIFDGWDRAKHVISYNSKEFPYPEIPRSWRRIRVVDFGFTNPFVCCWFAIDDDGRMYLYREWYKTQTLVEDHARKILELELHEDGWREPIEATICDHDAEDAATLRKYLQCATIPATKTVRTGIENLQKRLKVQDDGKPRFFVFSDCQVEADMNLLEPDDGAPKPTSGLEEIEGYVWNALKDQPIKENDHGIDTWRYGVMHVEQYSSDSNRLSRGGRSERR